MGQFLRSCLVATACLCGLVSGAAWVPIVLPAAFAQESSDGEAGDSASESGAGSTSDQGGDASSTSGGSTASGDDGSTSGDDSSTSSDDSSTSDDGSSTSDGGSSTSSDDSSSSNDTSADAGGSESGSDASGDGDASSSGNTGSTGSSPDGAASGDAAASETSSEPSGAGTDSGSDASETGTSAGSDGGDDRNGSGSTGSKQGAADSADRSDTSSAAPAAPDASEPSATSDPADTASSGGSGSDQAEAAPEPPAAPVTETSTQSPVSEEPTREAGPDPAPTGPSLPSLIRNIFTRSQPPAQAPVETVAERQAAPVPAPASLAVVDPAAVQPAVPPATVPPAAAPPAAAPARVVVAEAPRLRSHVGSGRISYRRFEISALGMTPRARQVVTAMGFRVIAERRSALLGNRVVAKLRTPRNQPAEAALARVRRALPEMTFDYAHLYRPSSERLPVRYAADMIGAPPVGSCAVGARIGLIDTGVGRHAALASAAITRRSFVDRNAATNVAHGTAIASLLVGDMPGTGALVPGSHLYSANVFLQDEEGLRADAHAILEALDWMASEGVAVVNLSLSGPPNALLEAGVMAAASRGQVLVAAAGNEGPAAGPAYPGAYPGVIAVAAVDARGRPYGGNNRGGYIEVSAPGVDIWAADARGGQAFWTGTSFAAPFVTATVARDLMKGRARNINDGRARLAESARDLGAPGRDPIYGHGLLQVNGCTGTGSPVLSSRD